MPAHEVQAAIESTGYPTDEIHCIAGKVEDTIPAQPPPTDRAPSPRHRLVRVDQARARRISIRAWHGGALIIDDYGHYEGARRAVDEYFAEQGDPVLLSRID